MYKEGWPEDIYSQHRAEALRKLGPEYTEEDFRRESIISEATQNKLDLAQTHFNPQLPYGKFLPRTSPDSLYVAKPVTVLDIETTETGRPIAISALKMQMNTQTGKFEIVDTYNRFYPTRTSQIGREALATHGLDRNKLVQLRREQIRQGTQHYSRHYNMSEAQDFKDFLGSSVIAGHNVVDFDIKNLFYNQQVFGRGKYVPINNQIIDTLIASRNLYGNLPGVKHGLDDLYQRFFGITMAGAGLPHHDAMSDTVATAQILNQMMRLKRGVHDTVGLGENLRQIMTLPGVSLGYIDKMMKGSPMLIKGGELELYASKGAEGVKYYMTDDEKEALSREVNHKATPAQRELRKNIEKIVTDELMDSKPITESTPQGMSQLAAIEAGLKDIRRAADSLGDNYIDLVGISASLGRQNRAAQIRSLSSVDRIDMADMAEALGITNKHEQYLMINAAQGMQQQRMRKQQFTELRSFYRGGLGDAPFVQQFRQQLSSTWNDWGPNQSAELDRAEAYAINNRLSKIDVAEASGLISKRQAKNLYSRAEEPGFDARLATAKKYRRDTDQAKADGVWRNRKIDRAVRHGSIDEAQAAELRLIKTNDALVDSLDEVALHNQQVTKTFQSIASIPMYDFSRWHKAMKNEVSGVFSAAQGVIPNFIRNPMSRLYTGAFNAYEEQVSPYKTYGTAAANILGPLIGGVFGGVPGAMIGAGAAKAGTQLIGAWGENKIVQKGEAMQTNLNALGAIFGWVATPFKLLGAIAKTLAGTFLSLHFGIKRLMESGLDLMGKMGNPLSNLTNTTMAEYQGSLALDKASMLGSGSVNSAVENFAQQQRDFYTLGKINEDRLIASTMLGVFGDVYSADPDANKHEQYYNMVNKILQGGVSPEEMAWASKIDNVLPSLLQTATTLDIDDIRDLTDPSRSGMYWNPLSSAERKRFQKAQYEWGAANMSFDNSKMRFADRVWTKFGKGLASGLSEAVDLAAQGNYGGAFDKLKDMFINIKDSVMGVWDQISDGKSLGETLKTKIWEPIKAFAIEKIPELISLFEPLLIGIYDMWSRFVDWAIEKTAFAVEFLSTVKIDPWKLFKGEEGAISYIGKNSYDNSTMLYNTKYGQTQRNKLWGSWKRRTPLADGSGTQLVDIEGPLDTVGSIWGKYRRAKASGEGFTYIRDTGGVMDIHNDREMQDLMDALYAYYEDGYAPTQIYSMLKTRGSTLLDQFPGAHEKITNKILGGEGNPYVPAMRTLNKDATDALHNIVHTHDYTKDVADTVANEQVTTTQNSNVTITIKDERSGQESTMSVDPQRQRAIQAIDNMSLKAVLTHSAVGGK